jgi:hypothetical protein
MDDVVISNADINGGSAAGGAVGSGSVEFGPKNGTICVINKYKGEASQTADPLFTAAFSTGPASNQYTSAHRGDGIAYLAMKWVLNEDSAETWEKFAPSNVKALVKGKPVYDPRLDWCAKLQSFRSAFHHIQRNRYQLCRARPEPCFSLG